jgi:hypothetical protein
MITKHYPDISNALLKSEVGVVNMIKINTRKRGKLIKLFIVFGPMAMIFALHFLLTELYGSFTYRHDLSEKGRFLGVFQPLNRIYPPLERPYPMADSQQVTPALPAVLTQTFEDETSAEAVKNNVSSPESQESRQCLIY